MTILIACEESQTVLEQFLIRGHDAWSNDIQEPSGKFPDRHLQMDAIEAIKLKKWHMMIAFPPCTHLASSGARWFAEKRLDGRQQAGIDFFMEMVNAPIEKICIENPVGIMSNEYREPDQIIQPFHHGHPEPKKTCLWLKNLPLLKPSNIVEPDFMRKPNGDYYLDAKGKKYSRIHFMSRNLPDRAKLRSKTYEGVAVAMANQWSKPISIQQQLF